MVPFSAARRTRCMPFSLLFLALLLGTPSRVCAGDPHGPAASSQRFPSHVFQLAPRSPKTQIGFHYGLVQPILTQGFNAAVDLRFGRLVLTYSHGQGLRADRVPGTLTREEKRVGMTLYEPYTTGGGVGITLMDELYVLADVKVHHFEAELHGQKAAYTTLTVGAEVGYRYFLWKGFYLSPVARYWPNVWDSAGGHVRWPSADGKDLVHKPVWQGIQGSGFFLNLLVGWAFGLEDA